MKSSRIRVREERSGEIMKKMQETGQRAKRGDVNQHTEVPDGIPEPR